MVKINPISEMHKAYGKSFGKVCGHCCNRRNDCGGYCIAFGKEYCTDGWPADAQACELYNKPFLAIRPRRKELGAYLESLKRPLKTVVSEDQGSLFEL